MISVNTKTGEVSDVIDPPPPTAAEIQAAADAEASAKAKSELAKIDAQSIRAMREFIMTKFPGDPLIPAALSSHNDAAILERGKIK